MNEEISLKLSKSDVEDITLMLEYNVATDFKDVAYFKFCGKYYGLFEMYCKNPDCFCTESRIELVEFRDGKTTDKVIIFTYDFKRRQITEIETELPPKLERELAYDEYFNKLLELRQAKVKYTFADHLLKGYKDKLQKGKIELKQMLSEQKINRNSPCTCGSGRKYKNCCGK